MTRTRASALAICFVGVLVVLRPGHEAFQPAALLMVLGALLFAIAAIATKKLIATETTFSIMLWMNLMQLPMNFAGSSDLHVLPQVRLRRWSCRCSASRSRGSRSTIA